MKVGIIGVMKNPAKMLNSHNGGWSLVVRNIMEDVLNKEVHSLTEKDDWNQYDLLIINEGINYKSGSYNFIGGVGEDVKVRLNKFANYNGKIRVIQSPVDYNDLCQKRKELAEFKNVEFRIPKVIDLMTLSNKLVLGDSHSLSVFKKGYTISRNDGKTLNGFLKKGIKTYIPENITDLIFYAGNIDIRFHLNRLPGSMESKCLDLCDRLEKQLRELDLNSISIVALIPPENESRKIPGTGKYKGENFFGSREERLATVNYMNMLINNVCKRNSWKFIEWPFDYTKELSFDHMESRQSVHLKPKSYMNINELNNQTVKQSKLL